jgi:hypothetical protein
MKSLPPLLFGTAIAVLIACNNVGSCPSSIKPGASCSGDNLSCPYTITQGSSSSACASFNDGGPVSTSCTCTGGVWVCPSCGSDDGGGGGDDGGGDAASEGGTEASGDGPAETAAEGGAETGAETSTEAGGEASTEGGGGDSGHD